MLSKYVIKVINLLTIYCILKYYLFIFQRKDYVKYAKVFPLSKTIDFKVPAKWYRRAVGGTEVLSGVCLAFVPYSKF